MSGGVFVLLFRGINVGGNKIVRMEKLREALTAAGFGNVTTYIQSGNVVLTSEAAELEIIATVERVFAESFGFTSRPTLRSLEAWRRIVDENPFPEAEADGRRVHAILLDAVPTAVAIEALASLATSERIELRDGVLYLHTPDGFGTSKVAAEMGRLKVPLTARNWNTVIKLRDMAEAIRPA